MKKFAANLRRILFLLTMVLSLILCVTHTLTDDTVTNMITLIVLCVGGLYLIVSIFSIIIRLIIRARKDERSRMIDSFSGVLIYVKNGRVIDFFRRLSLWGTIMLLVNILVFKITSNMLLGGPYSTDMFLSAYHGFLLWSLLALILTFVLSIFFYIFYLPHYGDGTYNVFQHIGKMLLGDLTSPFSIFKKNNGKVNVIGLITAGLFIVINAIAVIKNI